jgi:hypothetical protein
MVRKFNAPQNFRPRLLVDSAIGVTNSWGCRIGNTSELLYLPMDA